MTESPEYTLVVTYRERCWPVRPLRQMMYTVIDLDEHESRLRLLQYHVDLGHRVVSINRVPPAPEQEWRTIQDDTPRH